MNRVKNAEGKVYYKATGTVKSFNEEKGYGFIFTIDQPDEDIFFHASQVIAEGRDKGVKTGDEYEFLYTDYQDKGLRAYQIRKKE